MTDLKNIPLSNISMIRNYRDVEPPSEKDTDVMELAESIKKYEVMQAVLLRPDKNKKDHYQLIFGHRRFMASKVAGKETIPASIKEIADDDILELQVTENLQRKDVHPMDEAVAFKSLIDKKKYKVEEIALRFAKKPEYIAQRLKLNDLIPDAQKTFKTKGTSMLMGHAVLLARLTPDDQKETLKNRREFGSVSSLNDYIERNVMRDLSKASFDTKDATLFLQAGACTACPKRSGCSTL
ncbi:MAG: ParB/RepB/Spo0J family partition protein, partial [Ferruginibacter sp.]|nr:ParB/RepB/Spo0J family partition protein [Chitinophagaceae bacterium]